MWPGSCPAPNILRETVNRASAGADADSLARHARHDERDATPVRRPASVGCPVAQNHVAPELTSLSIGLGAIDYLNRTPDKGEQAAVGLVGSALGPDDPDAIS
jgi:hypothetical protein